MSRSRSHERKVYKETRARLAAAQAALRVGFFKSAIWYAVGASPRFTDKERLS